VRRDGPPRVAALVVPDLPLQRLARSRERRDPRRPLAIVADGRILCRDAAAAAEGVRCGATLAEALAACGRLEHADVDGEADRAALRALAEAMLALAPAVELAPPDALLLDASGAHLLAAGVGTRGRGRGEEILAARAVAAAAEMGYAARAAVATGRGPAGALARHGEGPISWSAPGGAADAIGRLPVAALGIDPQIVARLAALGVESAGALASLPEGTLAHRFGEDGVRAARIARGEDLSPLVAYAPETLPEEALDLEAPAESADPLLFGLKRLADRVAARLAGRGLGASRLEIVLRLDPCGESSRAGEQRLAVPLAAATASPARWILPVKEHLFSMRLPAPVIGMRLAAVEVARLAAEQLAIGDRPEALAALEGVLARVAVRLGAGALFAAEPVERHRPEGAYRAVPFRPRRRAGDPGGSPPGGRGGRRGGKGGAEAPSSAAEAGPRPTRLLSTPLRIVAEGEGGRVTALRVEGRARAVLAFEGPERLRGEWWAGPFDRDYYRVRLEGVGDCWVYRDGGDGRLYLHGFFD
jgi:protein ImuB